AGDEATSVEVHLVLLFGAPLAVMEHDGGHGDIVAHAGHGLHHRHAPGAVARIGNGRTVRSSLLGANDRWEGVAAVAEGHGGEETAWFFETQVAVGDRVDVADVGRHHDIFRHGLFQLTQNLA